jgi:peroxiredoxin Q/BCP
MQEGDSAPDFELPANDGSTVKLSSFKGNKNAVLCFYPKNHLFMCPSKKVFKMAQSVVAAYPEIIKANSVLFAISVDTVEDQKKFVTEYQIPYLHLSDTQKNVCKKYAGLNMAGLAKRSTFVIDKNGTVRKIFRDFDVEKHGAQIAKAVAELN